MDLVVARLGKPHGIRGEFTVEVRTDRPDERLVPGMTYATDPDIGELTLTSARWHRDRLLLAFDEVPDRTRAEEIRNTLLLAEQDDRVVSLHLGAQRVVQGLPVGHLGHEAPPAWASGSGKTGSAGSRREALATAVA